MTSTIRIGANASGKTHKLNKIFNDCNEKNKMCLFFSSDSSVKVTNNQKLVNFENNEYYFKNEIDVKFEMNEYSITLSNLLIKLKNKYEMFNSDGYKKLTAIVGKLLELNFNEKNTILFDEIENHLDSSHYSELYELITMLSKNNNVELVTHSGQMFKAFKELIIEKNIKFIYHWVDLDNTEWSEKEIIISDYKRELENTLDEQYKRKSKQGQLVDDFDNLTKTLVKKVKPYINDWVWKQFIYNEIFSEKMINFIFSSKILLLEGKSDEVLYKRALIDIKDLYVMNSSGKYPMLSYLIFMSLFPDKQVISISDSDESKIERSKSENPDSFKSIVDTKYNQLLKDISNRNKNIRHYFHDEDMEVHFNIENRNDETSSYLEQGTKKIYFAYKCELISTIKSFYLDCERSEEISLGSWV